MANSLKTQYDFLFVGKDEGSFVENYAYDLGEGGENSGKIFINMEISQNSVDAEKVGEIIFDKMRKIFFADSEVDGYERFEESLKEVNLALNEYKLERENDWLGKLNVIIAAIVGDQLYLTQAGEAEAYLVRKRFATTISDDLDENESKDVFTNIASGELEAGDFVLLSTTRLLRYVSKTDLAKHVNGHLQNTVMAIKEFLHGEVISKEYGLNDVVTATVENFTDHNIVVKNPCPAAPVVVQTLQNGTWQNENVTAKINCTDQQDYTILPAGKQTLTLQNWNHLYFGNLGQYKMLLTVDGKTLESAEFSVVPQSFFGWIWTVLIYQPIYNALILFASILPNHDFGFAIILLTILIRTILLIPNQRALKSQKKLQHIQPKINALKEKHGGDQQKIAAETMSIYKEHKVNPFGSCLPLIIQLPILIGLYNVIQTGINPNNTFLLYGTLQNFDLTSVNTIFLGILDLTKVNIYVLPIIVGLLQFFQLRLSMGRIKKAKAVVADGDKKKPANEMEMANKTMTLIMPFMIAFFTASVPSGVGLYWAFSTIYGILQQLVVNRQIAAETIQIKEIKS